MAALPSTGCGMLTHCFSAAHMTDVRTPHYNMMREGDEDCEDESDYESDSDYDHDSRAPKGNEFRDGFEVGFFF